MTSGTLNVLTDSGFDICLAVTQQAINSQMTYAWKAWKVRNKFQDKIRIFKKQKVKDGPIVDSNSGIEATFAPLAVNLTVENGKLGQVEVNLTMTSGTITYFEDGESATYSFNDVSIKFLVDLDKEPCNLADLKAIDPPAGQVAEDTITRSGLSESVFSIEYLFLKFTEIDLQNLPENHFSFKNDTPTEAITVAQKALNLMLWGKLAPNPGNSGSRYILGSVVRRNAKQAVPTFTMVDFLFDVKANWTAPAASTLNYLGVFSGQALPPNQDEARQKPSLRNPWVDPDQINGTAASIAGVMGFRKGKFVDEYLIHQLTEALNTQPSNQGLKWTYARTDTDPEKVVDNIIKQMFNQSQGYEITLEAVPGKNLLNISGKISSSFHYDGSTWIAPEKSNHTEWNYSEGYIPITGTCTLTGNGIGTDFFLRSDLQYSFGDPVVTRSEVGGMSWVSEGLAQTLKAMGVTSTTIQDLLNSLTATMRTNIKNQLDGVLGQFQIDLKEHKFIPPGGGVFTFQNPTFTQAGDLFMDVIYRAP